MMLKAISYWVEVAGKRFPVIRDTLPRIGESFRVGPVLYKVKDVIHAVGEVVSPTVVLGAVRRRIFK